MQVQVADFGLSRDIYERDYYSSDDHRAKLPVKWMAPESLEKGIYNIKTDVVSLKSSFFPIYALKVNLSVCLVNSKYKKIELEVSCERNRKW